MLSFSLRTLFSMDRRPRRKSRILPLAEQLEIRALLSALTKGGINSGSIGLKAEVDPWTFTGAKNDQVELISTSTALISGFNAYSEVFDPAGYPVASFWAGSNTELKLNLSGTYTVRVRDDNYTQTGRYTIGLEGIKPISPTPIALVKGGIVSGSITTALEKDQLTFTGKIGDRYEIITTSTARTAGFNAYTQVFAPSGTSVAGFWAGDNVILDLKENGTYLVQIRDDNYTQDGTYTVGLEGIKPISPGPVALPKGGIGSGWITKALEKDQFTFTGKIGERYEIITTSTARTAGFNAYTQVFAPSGTSVAGFWAGDNVILDLKENGTYLVQIRDDNYSQDGTYRIGLEGIKPISPTPNALVKGGIVIGSINTALEKDQLTFTGTIGERYEIITTSTARTAGFNAYTQVFAPSGTSVAGFWAGDNVVLDLKENGTYLVQVRDDNYSQDGSYTVGLEGVKPRSPNARALSPQTTVSGSIIAATQKDQWFITVPAGKKLSITLSGTAVDVGFAAYAEVYSSVGAKIGGIWAGTTTLTLPAGGGYLIQIRDAGLFKRGGYKLKAWFV